jgi:hypothetical protein
MAERTCYNCLYARCDPMLWLRAMWMGEEPVPRCANDPRQPGVLHEVTGVPCRNYQPRPPEPGDGVRRIPLGDGQYALVDAEDYEWLSQWRWHLSNGYATRMENRKNILMHREIMKPPKGKSVDHINHQKQDNRRINLRNCTWEENVHNRSKRRGSLSRFNGVTYKKRSRKWVATVWFNRKQTRCQQFDTEIEAARAYDRMAVETFGEFANVNFPEDWPRERREQVQAESRRAVKSSSGRTPVRARRPKVRKARTKKGRGPAGRGAGRVTRKKSRAVKSKRGTSGKRGPRKRRRAPNSH